MFKWWRHQLDVFVTLYESGSVKTCACFIHVTCVARDVSVERWMVYLYSQCFTIFYSSLEYLISLSSIVVINRCSVLNCLPSDCLNKMFSTCYQKPIVTCRGGTAVFWTTPHHDTTTAFVDVINKPACQHTCTCNAELKAILQTSFEAKTLLGI